MGLGLCGVGVRGREKLLFIAVRETRSHRDAPKSHSSTLNLPSSFVPQKAFPPFLKVQRSRNMPTKVYLMKSCCF